MKAIIGKKAVFEVSLAIKERPIGFNEKNFCTICHFFKDIVITYSDQMSAIMIPFSRQ